MRLQQEKRFTAADLSLDVMTVGVEEAAARGVPLIVVNEPIYRAQNSELRYNTYYPRWAYDSYRAAMVEYAAAAGWRYVDLWEAAPPEDFTDTDFHLNAAANCRYAQLLGELAK
jgi:hypothetical protein